MTGLRMRLTGGIRRGDGSVMAAARYKPGSKQMDGPGDFKEVILCAKKWF